MLPPLRNRQRRAGGSSGGCQCHLAPLTRYPGRTRFPFLDAWIVRARLRQGRPDVWHAQPRPLLLHFIDRLPALRKCAQSVPYSSAVNEDQVLTAARSAALRVAPLPLPSWTWPDMQSLPRSFPRSWMMWRPVWPALAESVPARTTVAQIVRSFFIANLHRKTLHPQRGPSAQMPGRMPASGHLWRRRATSRVRTGSPA